MNDAGMAKRPSSPDVAEEITALLAGFNLTTAAPVFASRLIEAGYDEVLPPIRELLCLEAEARRERRIARLRRISQLPPGKTFSTFEADRLPAPLRQKLHELERGDFLERGVNVLAFGLPGTGKTHAAAALGHALVADGHAVLFRPAYRLVQELQAAKRDLALPRLLRKLDHFELLILDDIGYIEQNPAEAEVLFTLIAERYERRSLLITSNLVFSEWEKIFPGPMATVAAIDRLVHHSAILEFPGPSYRSIEAAEPPPEKNSAKKKPPKSTK